MKYNLLSLLLILNLISAQTVKISGYITYNNTGSGINNVQVEFSNGGGNVLSQWDGYYEINLPSDWTGDAIPTKEGLKFSPLSRSYTNVTSDESNENYSVTEIYARIDGTILDNNNQPVEGVEISFSNGMGSVYTDKNGNYFKYINKDWSTTATPSKIGYRFSPETRTYSNISTDQFNEDYHAYFYMVKVEGYVQDAGGFKFSGVTINFSNGAGSKKTNSDGYYFKYLDPNWSGTVTPTKDGFTFEPQYLSYSSVDHDRTDQNFQISGPYFDGSSYASISGFIYDSYGLPMYNVEVSFGNYYQSTMTDLNGFYSSPAIRKGWIGSVTVSKDDFTFEPQVRNYSPLSTGESNQNFTGTSIFTFVSGWVRDDLDNAIQGVNIIFDNGGGAVTTNEIGFYHNYLLRGNTYTAKATKAGFLFYPTSRIHTAMQDEVEQNYSTKIDYNSAALSSEDADSSTPKSFTALPAFPNPFNPSTTLTYGLDREGIVNIKIYDVSGKLIATLINHEQPSGWHSIVWNGTDYHNNKVPAGIYIGKISTDSQTKNVKLMLLK